MKEVLGRIEQFVGELKDERTMGLYREISHGKMLRTKLITKIAPLNDETIDLCAIVEMIHLASLLHDDVIDDALSRRGVKSINAKHGDKTAIMLGDILYSQAFSKLTAFSQNISETLSSAVAKLSMGELLDVELGKSFNESFELYFDMIYKKTSALIEASAMAGAYLAHKDAHKYGAYGKNLGIAFQIVDDILDVISDDATLGKPAMNDLKEGKVTLPYLYFYHDGDGNDKSYLKSLFGKELSMEQKMELKARVVDAGAITKSQAYAKRLIAEAVASIADEHNLELVHVATAMIEREF